LNIDYELTSLCRQSSVVSSWRQCAQPELISESDCRVFVTEFEKRVANTAFYGDFLKYLKGYTNTEGIPVTYPRVPQVGSQRAEDGKEILEWFIQSERQNLGISLPPIGNSTKNALPFLRRPERNGNQNRGHNGPRR
jgi:hypothetical protein